MKAIFENLLLLGRPASGKSEFIDFMKKVDDEKRAKRYHFGPFEELDDFPWIWEKLFIEFARGGKDAYQKALNVLSPEILKKAAILFVLVSYEESCRRNEARYREKLQHSILAHKVPDETMQNFYQTHDWLTLTKGQESGYLTIQATKIPFVTMKNEPELTDSALLDKRYHAALQNLWELKK